MKGSSKFIKVVPIIFVYIIYLFGISIYIYIYSMKEFICHVCHHQVKVMKINYQGLLSSSA